MSTDMLILAITLFCTAMGAAVSAPILRLGGRGYGVWVGTLAVALVAGGTVLAIAPALDFRLLRWRDALLVLLGITFLTAMIAGGRHAYAGTLTHASALPQRRLGKLVAQIACGCACVVVFFLWLLDRLH